MSTALQGTERADRLGPKRVRYTHDAMIDQILINPKISQDELALMFGFSVPWVSTVINSDSFRLRMASRKTELVDPVVVKELNERIDTLAHISLSILHDKLVQNKDAKLALATAELTMKALGFGARADKNPTIQNNFVVALPAQAASSKEWAEAAKNTAIDAVVKEIQNG